MSARLVWIGSALFLVAMIVVACAETPPTPTTTASARAPGTLASPALASGAPGSLIVVEEDLLRLLPAKVDGVALVSDPDTAASVAADPDLATSASAIAVAYAIGPSASVGEDVAVVSVVRLRSGVYDDAFHRSWRDSYDAAACQAAGGVTGNAQAEVGGHETFIGSCAQGAFTYHVYLEDQDVLVSITSVGARRLGEQVVAGLGE